MFADSGLRTNPITKEDFTEFGRSRPILLSLQSGQSITSISYSLVRIDGIPVFNGIGSRQKQFVIQPTASFLRHTATGIKIFQGITLRILLQQMMEMRNTWLKPTCRHLSIGVVPRGVVLSASLECRRIKHGWSLWIMQSNS